LEQFDRRYDELTPEEREYSQLLTVLIEAFEDANYALEGSTSDSRLRSLMEEHGCASATYSTCLVPAA
jgi:hypothetical protein